MPESKLETLQDVCPPRTSISKDSAFREVLNDPLDVSHERDWDSNLPMPARGNT